MPCEELRLRLSGPDQRRVSVLVDHETFRVLAPRKTAFTWSQKNEVTAARHLIVWTESAQEWVQTAAGRLQLRTECGRRGE